MTRLTDTLWYERRLLKHLLSMLVSANPVLIADDRRFVGPAVAELDAVMSEIRKAEEQRSIVNDSVAAEFGVSPAQVSMNFLVEASPAALRATFEGPKDAFMKPVGEIEVLTKENRRLATVGLDSIQATLVFAGGGIYDAAGRATRTPDHPVRVNDERLHLSLHGIQRADRSPGWNQHHLTQHRRCGYGGLYPATHRSHQPHAISPALRPDRPGIRCTTDHPRSCRRSQ